MLLVDPVAEDGGGVRELDARVDAVGLAIVGGDMGDDSAAGADDELDRVGQVELALHVLRLEPLERRPQRGRPEDVDRAVDLADPLHVLARVGSLDDLEHAAVGAADDAAVEARVGRLGAQDRRVRALAPVRLDELVAAAPAVSIGVSPERISTSPS